MRGDDNVVPLGKEPPPEPPPVVTPPRRLHGLAMLGATVSGLIAAGCLFAFITVRWPGDSGRRVIGVMLFSILVSIACAAIAVFSAARDTYATGGPEPETRD